MRVCIRVLGKTTPIATDMFRCLSQVDYYTRHIKSNPAWDFVEVYSDEGVSATSTKKRAGFNRMIADALNGKIDLILTKSISRFARNSVDTLSTVRQLKEKNVEVFFEKENIYTLDSKGELMITIISSLAQEESHNLSLNIAWGKRKGFADGKFSLPYGQFLGYEKGKDGLPKIVEKEARVVRMIYKLFLEGKTPSGIARLLTDQGVKTPAGKTKWHSSTVTSILTNEKMKGDCGSFYGRKVWHSNSKYATTVWHCNKKFHKKEFCTTPHLKEKLLKKAFVEVFNGLITNKAEILSHFDLILVELADFMKQEQKSKTIDEECSGLEQDMEKLIAENARLKLSQEDYNRRYTPLVSRYNHLQKEKQKLGSEIASLKGRLTRMRAFMAKLKQQENLLEEFDEELWCATLNTVVVKSSDKLLFQFKDGSEWPWVMNHEG